MFVVGVFMGIYSFLGDNPLLAAICFNSATVWAVLVEFEKVR